MSTDTAPNPTPDIDDLITAGRRVADAMEAKAIKDNRKSQRARFFLRKWWEESVGDVLGALIIAWCLDRIRPAEGMGWLPHLTWWQVLLSLLVLGTLTGSLTGTVRARLWTWDDYDGPQ